MLTDDVGSFPIENKESLNEYFEIYDKILLKEDYSSYKFYNEVYTSFKLKLESGLDVICYPQLQNMYDQFLIPIKKYQEEPYLINEGRAIIVENEIVKRLSKEFYEETGKKLLLKVCVTGPIELYLKEFGNYMHKDLLENFARSVRRFIKNSIINERYAETYTISIDEPSIGYVDFLNISIDDITDIIDKAVKGFKNVQIHLHSLKVISPILNSEVKIIGCEFASNPINIELIKYEELEKYDKFLRAGIIRTDVDRMYAEIMSRKGKVSHEDYIEDLSIVKFRLNKIIEKFRDRVMFIGPDCGLRSFPNKIVAKAVLERVVEAKKHVWNIDKKTG